MKKNIDDIMMEDDEIDESLGCGGVGVISLSTSEGESPVTVPVSYGYDRMERKFYFRLEVDPGTRKRTVLGGESGSFHAAFVTLNNSEDGWWSVVAEGMLVDVEDTELPSDSLEGLRRVDIPMMDIFGKPTKEVEFSFYELKPRELTGYKEQRVEM